MKKIEDYFTIDLYVDDKFIVTSKPFTTTSGLISVCKDIANTLVTFKEKECEVLLYRNKEYEDSHDFYNQHNYFRNFCEVITAIYYHCDFDLYINN